jgi:hypothetical protein
MLQGRIHGEREGRSSRWIVDARDVRRYLAEQEQAEAAS